MEKLIGIIKTKSKIVELENKKEWQKASRNWVELGDYNFKNNPTLALKCYLRSAMCLIRL